MCAPIIAAGITAVASIGMGIYSANQQASMAGQSLQMQAQQAQANVAMQNRQAMQQQATAQQQAAMQRTQFASNQALQRSQQFQQQQFQAQQSALQMQQQAEFQAQNQRLQVEQTQKAQRFQQEQAAKSRNLQIEQMNAQLADKYAQQREAIKAERAQLMQKHQVDRRLYQDSKETAEQQMRNNAEEANRVYTAEQARLDGKRKEAAFEAQSILAKSIGAKGSILASGRTGQSIGLLVNDVERQAGIQKAQQTAMLESDRVAAIIGMDNAFAANQTANQQAESQVGFNPDMPYLPSMPQVPTFVGFEIPK